MSHNLLANLPCTSLIHRISSRRYKEKMRAINRVIGIKIIINNNSSLQNSPYNFTHGTHGYCTNSVLLTVYMEKGRSFLYSVYMQRVLLVASTRKILAPYKLASLGRS